MSKATVSLMVAIVVLGLTTMLVLVNWKREAHLQACNLTPYAVRTATTSQFRKDKWHVSAWRSISAGDCIDEQLEFRGWFNKPAVFVYAEAVDRDAVNWLIERQNALSRSGGGNDYAFAMPFVAEGDALAWTGAAASACIRFSGAIRYKQDAGEVCRSGEERAGFVLAAGADEAGKEWAVRFEHPGYSFMPPGSDPSDTSIARLSARALAASIQRQRQFSAEWSGRQVPFLLGSELVDLNSPIMPGVYVQTVWSTLLSGDANPIAPGDELLSIDGEYVYGIADVKALLIRHGTSRAQGITVPLDVVLARRGTAAPFHVQTMYFFNESYPQFAGDYSGQALVSGIFDSVFLGGGATGRCAAATALTGVARFLQNVGEAICEKSDSPACRGSTRSVDVVDFKECQWQNRQLNWLEIQKHRNAFTAGNVIGFLGPSALRLAVEGAVERGVARSAERSALQHAAREATMAGAEMAIWNFAEYHPGLPIADRARGAGASGRTGSAIGFFTGAILHH